MTRHVKIFSVIQIIMIGALIVHWQLVWRNLQLFGAPLLVIPAALIVHVGFPLALIVLYWLRERGRK